MSSSRALRPAVKALSTPCKAISSISGREVLVVTKRELNTRSILRPEQCRAFEQSRARPSPLSLRHVALSSNRVSLINQQRNASSGSGDLNRTPLYDLHVELGAKMGPFANYSMPLEYPDQSHPASHKWTREHASLFDVSHMVQHKMSGPLAEEFLMTITPSSLKSLPKHSSTLSTLLDSSGGIVDDTVITRIGKDSFYFVTNAGCRETDLEYLKTQLNQFLSSKSAEASAVDWHVLDHHALVALQGPEAASVLQPLVFVDPDDTDVDTSLETLYFGHSRWLQLTLPDETNTPSLLISRTGYTGEDGFEISIPSENGDSKAIATAIAKALTSDTSKVRWAGLAARDSLRLEAGMCLYGHDITLDTTPPMAALGWIVGKDRRSNPSPPFNGHEVINSQLASPKTLPLRRVGLIVEKGPAAREGAELLNDANEVVGTVTSGCPAPSLDGTNIAMALVKTGFHKKGTKLGVRVRKNVRAAEVAKMPFVENRFYRSE